MTLDPLPHTRYKNYLKISQRPNHESSNYKTLRRKHRRNIGDKLHDIGFGNDFLGMIPKHRGKKLINKWNFIKIKTFCIKEHCQQKATMEWEKISENYMSDKK